MPGRLPEKIALEVDFGVRRARQACRALRELRSRPLLRMDRKIPQIGKTTGNAFCWRLFAGRHPCVLAPDPVSLLTSRARPIPLV
jgi:hypothetical protein